MFDALTDIAAHRWGQGASIEWYMQGRAGSARMREAFARFERMAISPSSFLRMSRMIRDIDVRAVLPAIQVPTLVIQRLDDRITPPCHGRYLAAHIAGARYFEQPGDHSLRFAASGNSAQLYAEIAGFLASTLVPDEPDRVLATILHAKTVLARGHPEDLVREYRGRLIRTTADGILATFDAPGQAIRCAAAFREEAAAAGIQIRAGIHTGEVDLVGEDIAGTSVQITDRIAALARPAEILVSRTVKDLVAGSGITFAERGSHALNGPSDEWPLFAVTGFTAHLSSPDGLPGRASDGGCCSAKNAPPWRPWRVPPWLRAGELARAPAPPDRTGRRSQLRPAPGPERFLFRPRQVCMVEGGSRWRGSQLMQCSLDQALQSTLAILTRVRPEDLDGPRPAV